MDEKAVSWEKSLMRTHRAGLWNRMIESIRAYELLRAGDKVAVCVSGGKDSMLLAKMMQILQKHSDFPFEVVFLAMDPGYQPENRALMEENARRLGVPLQIFETKIFDALSREKSPCYLCARMRRGHLYAKAKELGCNKIALGHHQNDVVETTLMGMLYGGQLQAMLPKLKSRSFPGMELIRPLYRVREEEIALWAKENAFTFLDCACPLSQREKESGVSLSKRAETRRLIEAMKRDNARVEENVFHSIHTLSLDTFPRYKQGGVWKTFDERFEEE